MAREDTGESLPVRPRDDVPRSYVLALVGVAAVTAALAPFHDRLSSTTVALALLLVVLFVAAARGMRPAVAAAVAGMLSFNFFFLPPVHTFTIENPQNWVALSAFLLTAITAGQLSARAKRRAEEAETGRLEIERLYTELRDVFDRASRAEALRQAERMRTALLDAVTHDLRTPLTSIKVSVSTLIEEVRVPPEGAEAVTLDVASRLEMLDVIDEETDRLNRLIENFVELARIEAGQIQLRRRWTSPQDVVDEAVARAARRFADRPIERDSAGDLPVIHADGRALAEAVFTLVENAAKYSPPGTRIRVSARPARPGAVEFAVEDEGPGIPEAFRERVFEKFFRLEGTERAGVATPSGTGMGLAIARGIVEAHSGIIGVTPSGCGARIAFTIPVGDDDGMLPGPLLSDEDA